MGCLIDEKTYEYEDENHRWIFRLILFSDPMDDPSVTIRKQNRVDDGWVLDEVEGVYHRSFDRGDFNEQHYANFRSKFVRDPEYREQYYEEDLSIDLRQKRSAEA